MTNPEGMRECARQANCDQGQKYVRQMLYFASLTGLTPSRLPAAFRRMATCKQALDILKSEYAWLLICGSATFHALR